MATIVIAHGAWSAGWAWKKMRPLMAAVGHELWTPTYTGLGERRHLARPDVDLNTHIQDVVAVLETEDLSDVVLVGHSYGGMVATGVADRARDRIAKLVYLDAFVPRDGQSLTDFTGPGSADQLRQSAQADGGGWLVPPRASPPDTSEADLAWTGPRRAPQPIGAFTTPVRLANGEPSAPRSYILCTRSEPVGAFAAFAERARTEAGWRYFEIEATHNPHITAPAALARLLDEIVRS
jgi:pimeloyl-ACP methyl ester carboxylesterase